jgi:hypothetical protein
LIAASSTHQLLHDFLYAPAGKQAKTQTVMNLKNVMQVR